MALDDILSAIKKEGEEKISDIHAKADERIAELKKNHKKELSALEGDINDKVQSSSTDLLERGKFQLRVKHKSAVLSKKRELISGSFDSAVQELSKMDDDMYVKIIVQLLSKLDDEQYVIFAAKGKEELTKKAISESKKGFELSSEPIESVGGFRAVSGSVEIDNSFETLVDSLRDDVEPKVVKQLFA